MIETINFRSLRPALQRALVDAHLRFNLSAFIHRAFETVCPGDEFMPNWHIDAIADALDRIRRGKTTRLLIMMPPRHLKSISVSVAFPAFLLGHDPARKIIAASYSDALAAKHHNDCRAVVNSDWYRRLFPQTRVSGEKNNESEFMTTLRGGRYATSVGGTLTGRGGDLIIIDDPMKPDEATSESSRKRVQHWYESTLLSRLNNKQNDAIIVVMQRLHVDDLAGLLIEKGGWDLLELQAIAEERQSVPIGPGRVHYRETGDVLHPSREPQSVLDEMKRTMGSFDFSAQYQQRPVPAEGHMIKRSWISWYDEPPNSGSEDILVVSWDTASKASELADYSVGTVWRVKGQHCYLLDLVRGHYDFPHLKQAALALRERWPGATTLIEDKSSGMSLIQELRSYGIPVIGTKTAVDKITRLHGVEAMFEEGSVHLPRRASWLDELLKELLAFPNYRTDDQVDSVSQALRWILDKKQRVQKLPVLTAYSVDTGVRPFLPNRMSH